MLLVKPLITVFMNISGFYCSNLDIDLIEVNEKDFLEPPMLMVRLEDVSPQLFPLTNEYFFGMMVYGDENSDNIEFEYFNYLTGKTFTLNHDLPGFEVDMIVGDY